MNLFIHCLRGHIEGFFFDNEATNMQIFSVPHRAGIIDELSKYPASTAITKIFVVTGPASFTSLRNISVFCNTFSQFSNTSVELYCIPTLDILPLLFPKHSQYILSVGRRESFIFANNTYQKYKNPIIAQKNILNSAGFYSSELLELLPRDFLCPQEEEPQKIATSLLQSKKQSSWMSDFVNIEYGALPNIG